MAGAYWYLYARPDDEAEPSGGGVTSAATDDGAGAATERQPA